MIISGLLALAMSVAVAFGPLATGNNQAADRRVAAVTAAADRAYHDIGFGLYSALQEQSAPAVLASSVQETYRLVSDSVTNIDHRFVAHMQQTKSTRPFGSDQTAAASDAFFGSLFSRFGQAVSFAGEELGRQLSWLNQPAATPAPPNEVYLTAADKRLVESSRDAAAADTDTVDDQQPATAARPDRGAVVVPAPTSSAARSELKARVQQQFSDPVSVRPSSTDAGIIQPQFGDRKGDEYMYVMVPTDESATDGSAEP